MSRFFGKAQVFKSAGERLERDRFFCLSVDMGATDREDFVKIAVLVPTYRRPVDLIRCLEAIAQQSFPPDQVIVVRRHDDLETASALCNTSSLELPLEVVLVEAGGQVAALNAGIASVRCDIVAITDDDAAPHPFWLNTIHGHFLLSPRVGGVGGKDYVFHDSALRATCRVGILTWYGRTIGNHHIGIGGPRKVHFLKGANMSYRSTAIAALRFDERLLGSGAQVHNDLAFALSVTKRGWTIVYDPSIVVNHFPAERFDEDSRSGQSSEALLNSACNETIALLDYLPWYQQPFFWLWAAFIGSRALPGIAQCIRFSIVDASVWWRFINVQRGRIRGAQISRSV